LFPHLFLLPWRWKRHVPPTRRFIISPHCVTLSIGSVIGFLCWKWKTYPTVMFR
jgi:hypothetical protein